MRIAYCDLEQAESRTVGAIIYRLFGDSAYLNAQECGDPHSLVCSMGWKNLPWPEDFNLTALATMPNRRFPPDLMKAAKTIANREYYRGKSYRDMAKTLAHGCLTADHEVLTRDGWVPIYKKPSAIVQSNGILSPVSNWIDKYYTGIMFEWGGQAISVNMTADHRVYYKNDSKDIKIRAAKDIPLKAHIALSGSEYIGGYNIEPKARLLAAFHCDGSIRGKKVRFHLHDQRKIDRLQALCDEAGIAFGAHLHDNYTASFIPSLLEPDWCMLEWHKNYLIAYMDELPYWDGHFGKASTSLDSNVGMLAVWNKNLPLWKRRHWLEKWQTFNRLLGFGGNIQKPQISGFGTQMFTLQINSRRFAARKSFTIDKTTEVERARVFCPTVPAGSFYIRRNGKISVTGNSNYYGQPATMASHTHTDVKIISAFQRAYFAAFPFISRWHQWVQYQLETTAAITTLLGRHRKFLGRPDDPATLREMIAFEPQSVATGDYMNAGMLAVWNKNLPLWLHKQVHDALAFSYDRRDEDWLIPEVCSILSWPITLTAHPDQLVHLQALPRRSRREDTNLQALLTLPPREFRIPVEAEVGWNLSRRKEWAKDGTRLARPINPNGLITWRPERPDTRRRLPTKALTAVERLSLSMGHLNDNKKQ